MYELLELANDNLLEASEDRKRDMKTIGSGIGAGAIAGGGYGGLAGHYDTRDKVNAVKKRISDRKGLLDKIGLKGGKWMDKATKDLTRAKKERMESMINKGGKAAIGGAAMGAAVGGGIVAHRAYKRRKEEKQSSVKHLINKMRQR